MAASKWWGKKFYYFYLRFTHHVTKKCMDKKVLKIYFNGSLSVLHLFIKYSSVKFSEFEEFRA